MLKKILCMLASIFAMMIYCASPLIVHAEDQLVFASDSNSDFPRFIDYIDNHSTDKYFLVKFSAPLSNGTINHFMGYIYVEQPYLGYVSLSSSDGVYSISSTRKMSFHYASYEGNWVTGDDVFTLSFDSVNHSLTLYDDQHNPLVHKMNNLDTPYSGINIYDVTSNFFDIQQYNALNLSISFEPDLSGSVSRKSIHNGKEFTSVTLDLHVTNFGDDAQFSWFILPHGDSMSFPSSLLHNAQGFNDNPTYVYVCDEWLGFQIAGMQGNSLYCPTSWHSVPHGYTNQIYHVPWNHMKLSSDTSYDVVVYACTNSISHGEKLVSADLSNVQEVYRSTFTISDPAVYSPSGDAYGDHPWDPEEDHSNLFNVSSAFKDDYGNVVIRGQTRSGGGLVLTDSGFVKYSDFSTSSKATSFRLAFNNFIGFVTYVFSRFPRDISDMYYYSFLCVSVLGIIKAVIH